MSNDYRYDDDYEETVTLSDGSSATLRTIRPHDKESLRRAFEQLSPASRYLRFFAAKAELTDAELRYLTEVDGLNHCALVAFRLDPIGREEGLGVARFVRLDGEPGVAEPAVAVVDSAQGKGLGTLLLHRLAAAASERGIERFRAEFLSENKRMRHLFEELVEGIPGGMRLEHSQGITVADMRVPAIREVDGAPEIPRQSAVRRLLSQAASGAIVSRLRAVLSRGNPLRDHD